HLHFSEPDHAPYAKAFKELVLLFFIELLDQAADYNEALARADAMDSLDYDTSECDDEDVADDERGDQDCSNDAARPRSIGQRFFDMALASGCLLRIKADGWKLFCERLNVPPLLCWERFPGFERIQRALAMAEQAAFDSESFIRWLNHNRPEGESMVTTLP